MRKCIYCEREKEEKEFSLEHIIPQFLGGSQSPDKFKIRNVCKTCNSNLGLFVDAGFEKSFLVYSQLKSSAEAFFNPENPTSLPLHCMGNSDLSPPSIQDKDVCEYWLGPLGEQIFWIRPADDRLYWYSGGNPRTVKKKQSRAYFMFSERSNKNLLLTWLSFRDAFRGRKVKKIMCTHVTGSDPKDIGFSEPDEIDKVRILFFKESCSQGEERKNKIVMYTRYDHRFLAKLSIGIAYGLFGEKILKTNHTKELLKGLWYREGDKEPAIYGTTALSGKDNYIKKTCGIEYATTITLLPISEGVAVILNINTELNWVIMCASQKDLSENDLEYIGDGMCFIFFQSLNRCVSLKLSALIAHKNGNNPNPELSAIYTSINKHINYFKEL